MHDLISDYSKLWIVSQLGEEKCNKDVILDLRTQNSDLRRQNSELRSQDSGIKIRLIHYLDLLFINPTIIFVTSIYLSVNSLYCNSLI